uniref:Uncharacterized protein n=1 Tax=Chromera velia CCMP2878 TaxID=1169474 RepID=A0A0G4I9S9_9ALVE|mmetsp:Transcript_44308/g.87465  ORF Transcript_44308/g.87465 Transcript_44308/m.87465 type:complete len:178 (-) Transcript_44308:704-1237(-)|eukprot:Cvel_12235.t1-p1 / transcript=Cvel_12235.t1 / gene=Cvel_12235 / organism=Chromera_velia_CCMP2878 / gene_product=hypothetical protein / transcript_product=hypothetical protein / location=Cvel_scaffold792:46578-47506(-) / protein_length=177 / sequence_SO=supercontig / SO=protein_coding / is_pseudo=false
MDGFIEEKRELTVEDNLLDLAFALSPELEALQWRYVLSWGRHPRDLDLYLSVSKDGEKKCTAFWQHKTCTFPGGTAVLDVDEQQGYGPETITVTLDSAEAATGLGFNVHVERYAGEGTTGASGAVVRAFNGNKAVGTWNVPTTLEATWDVYEGTPPLPQLKGGLLLSRESLPKVLVA